LPTFDEEHNLGNDLGFSPQQRSLVAHMESAAILPEFRGRGIQKKLISAAEARVAALGYRYSLCTVHPDNLPSFRSLVSLGYQVAETKLKYGGKLRHIMKKELPAGA
ncbi:MAG: GNAT family N-acetyltransferase, partial [Oscillospiraceae bacterium]|nr:GNAT family N-acetyltransferase [Oscillospiraceae bacterium]